MILLSDALTASLLSTRRGFFHFPSDERRGPPHRQGPSSSQARALVCLLLKEASPGLGNASLETHWPHRALEWDLMGRGGSGRRSARRHLRQRTAVTAHEAPHGCRFCSDYDFGNARADPALVSGCVEGDVVSRAAFSGEPTAPSREADGKAVDSASVCALPPSNCGR